MTIQGLQPVGSFDRSVEQPLQLRLNQRVTAEILNVSGDQVNLVIQGVRVVGRLQSGDQATLLADRRTAQFIIKGMTDGVLQLQVVQAGKGVPDAPLAAPLAQLAQNLLMLNGIEINEQNLTISRALLSRGLPVTPDLVENLQQNLASLGTWGQVEADVAAALQAGGLPLSPGTLSLALQHGPTLAEGALGLEKMLTRLVASQTTPEVRELARQVLETLREATVNWKAPLSNLVDDLPKAVALWGRSIEAEIASKIMQGKVGGETLEEKSGWMMLAQLRRSLDHLGNQTGARQIDRFMETVRQMQFLNSARSSDPGNPTWLVVSVPLSMEPRGQAVGQDQAMFQAHLRVAYRSGGGEQTIDPENTRLVLTIDLEKGDYLQADLSIIGKRLGAWMTVSNDELRQRVEQELPTLEVGLERLGIKLQFARCETGVVGPVVETKPAVVAAPARGINMEA